MKANIKTKLPKGQQDKTVFLSIGMIVKNESRYLRRCLSAMVDLLQKTNGELIIVDTGSTDDTVEIAREFTDKVYFFEWNNDFSAARNETLKHAVGEWYMFVDADEIFENTDGIVELVTSHQPKNINLGAYNIHNIIKRERNEYIIATLFRLHRMYDGIKFEHPIHENIEIRPGSMAIYLQDVRCMHYGYSDELTKAQARRKEKRNTDLLESSLEKDPDNTHYLLHYVREFNTDNADYERQLKYINHGVEVSVGNDNHYAFLTIRINFYIKYGKYHEAKKAYREFMDTHDDMVFSDIDCSYSVGMTAFYNNEYETAVEVLDKFVKAYIKFDENAIATPDFAYNPQVRLSPQYKLEGIVTLAYCRYKVGDDTDIKRLPELVDLSETQVMNDNAPGIAAFLKYCNEEKEYAHIPKLYRQALNKPILLDFLEKRISSMTNKPDERLDMAKAFSVEFSGSETPFVEMQFVLLGKKNYRMLFKTEMSKRVTISPDLLMVMIQNGADYTDISNEIPNILALEACAEVTAKRYSDFDRVVYDYIRANSRPDDLRGLYVYSSLCSVANRTQMMEPQELHFLFVQYSEALFETVKLMYNPAMLRPENLEMLPTKYRFAVCMNDIKTSLRDNNYIEAVRGLKKALRLQNEFVSDIEYYMQDIVRQEKESALTAEEKSEFETLARTLIAKARELAAAGMKNEANMIVNQLSAIMPGDKRIKALKEELQ